MADVRLTATNPADSSVVPVACNEKGELKLEEVPTFDGNLDGDLSVTGSTTLTSLQANSVQVGGDYANVYAQSGQASGQLFFNFDTRKQTVEGQPGKTTALGVSVWEDEETFNQVMQVAYDGTTNFKAYVNSTRGFLSSTEGSDDYSFAARTSTGGPWQAYITGDGAATFAGNKAGFTKEGYLWCTTERGDTVVLQATSNGMGMWEPYSPPTRREEIKDAWSEKNVLRPKPEESSQD